MASVVPDSSDVCFFCLYLKLFQAHNHVFLKWNGAKQIFFKGGVLPGIYVLRPSRMLTEFAP